MPHLGRGHMASFSKMAKGWRAQIKVMGVRDSRVFTTRREAVQWAARREDEIRYAVTAPLGEQYTLRQALRRYADEVSATKRGARWEQVRLAAFEGYRLPLDTPIGQVTDFRDARGASVGPAAVLRELTLLSSVFVTVELIQHFPLFVILPKRVAQSLAKQGKIALAPMQDLVSHYAVGIIYRLCAAHNPLVQSILQAARLCVASDSFQTQP